MINLNLLLSSTFSSKLLFNELLFFDILDRFCFSNFKFFKGISIILDLKLPFSNSLLKFKNKIYLILYFLIFEMLFTSKPRVVPVYSKKALGFDVLGQGRKTKKVGLGSSFVSVSFFRLSSVISSDFSFLTALSIFISKNTYKDLVVLSRFIKLNTKLVKNKKISSLSLKSATNVFEFLSTFEEFVLSKAQIKINFNFDTFVGLFLIQALGFNTMLASFYTLKFDKKLYLL